MPGTDHQIPEDLERVKSATNVTDDISHVFLLASVRFDSSVRSYPASYYPICQIKQVAHIVRCEGGPARARTVVD